MIAIATAKELGRIVDSTALITKNPTTYHKN